MTKSRRLRLLILVTVLAAPFQGWADEPGTRVVSVRYEEPGVICIPAGIGVFCFTRARLSLPIASNEDRVTVTAVDDHGLRVRIRVYDDDPLSEGSGDTCGPTGVAETAVTPGARLWLDVYADPVRPCGASPVSLATSGTLTVTFYVP